MGGLILQERVALWGVPCVQGGIGGRRQSTTFGTNCASNSEQMCHAYLCPLHSKYSTTKDFQIQLQLPRASRRKLSFFKKLKKFKIFKNLKLRAKSLTTPVAKFEKNMVKTCVTGKLFKNFKMRKQKWVVHTCYKVATSSQIISAEPELILYLERSDVTQGPAVRDVSPGNNFVANLWRKPQPGRSILA